MKSIFKDAIAKKHDSIAIFDDDFILSKSFDQRFVKVPIELIGDSWEIIYLGASQWLWDSSSMPTTETYHPDENTNGSFAVICRRSVFKQLIDEIEKMDSPFRRGDL